MADAPKPERPAEPPEADRRLVVIFGGGVTGLAAAHELIERGFRVHVLEPTESLNHYGSCDVGGMARTQYAHLEKEDGRPKTKDKGPLTQVPRVHGTPHLVYFAQGDLWDEDYALGNHVANQWQEPSNLTKLKQLAAVMRKVRDLHQAAGVTKTVLRVIGHTCDSEVGRVSRDTGCRRADKVRTALQHVDGWPKDVEVTIDTRGAAEPIGNNNHPSGRARNNRVSFEIDEIRLPGEHGYRFYPAFYWHLDDQLKRIPVYDDNGKPTYRCVLDNLEHAENARFAIEDGEKPLLFDRRLPRSFDELRRTAEELGRRLKFPPDDVALFQLKMFKFMTSSTQRRKAEYEKISWWDFVEGDRYAENTQRHLLAAPQALVAMEAYVTDAYTAGNIYTQLLLDHLSGGTRVDRTMNAPTSEAWLRHWKRFLLMQGVKFFVGELTGFEVDGTRLLPTTNGKLGGEKLPKPMPEPVYKDEEETLAGVDRHLGWQDDADYYILALPAEAAKKVLATVPDGVLDETLDQLKSYDVGRRELDDKHTGPLRDFVGIQFYFDHDVKFTSGHTYYPDSDWGLSSISQLQFWKDRRTRDGRYLGVLSVDIGNMVAPDRSRYRQRVLAARTALRNAERATRRSTVGFTAKQRAAVRQALADANAAREAATSLIEQLPLRLSKDFRKALRGSRDSARGFTKEESKPAAAALRQALSDTRKQARTGNDRRVSRILAGVHPHLDALADAAAVDPKGNPARYVTRAFTHLVDAMRFTDEGKTAWQSDPREIAQTVWRQIKLGLDTFQAQALPDPLWFHLDDNLEFEPKAGKLQVKNNSSPFQINPAGEFERRPGAEGKMPPEVNDETDAGAFDRNRFEFYQIANEKWVVAGMFSKTYTRLATMEMAVESGRHAVNAILHDIAAPPNQGIGKIVGDLCQIQSPERREIADLAFLKRIDEQLLAEGLPHFVDIVGLEDALLAVKRMRDRGIFGDSPLDHALRLLRVAFRTGRSELSPLQNFVPMPNLMPFRDTLHEAVDKVAGILHTVLGFGTNEGGSS